jgi:hypothetical protein
VVSRIVSRKPTRVLRFQSGRRSRSDSRHRLRRLDLSVYGPGDVLGIDTSQIVRIEPRQNATDVESNYFPAIEFDAPDFPWLFTPAVSGANDRLRPWCVLIVIDLSVVDAPRAEAGHPLPVIVVPSEVRSPELPDLADSWAWAHTQVVAAASTSSTDVATSLSSQPAMNVSRLVAPRRLEPNRRYAACLVPAFDAGVSRGLIDAAPTTGALNPAWSDGTLSDVRLPVYFHWEFSTGAAGGFESLARRLAGGTADGAGGSDGSAPAGRTCPRAVRRPIGVSRHGRTLRAESLHPTRPTCRRRFKER